MDHRVHVLAQHVEREPGPSTPSPMCAPAQSPARPGGERPLQHPDDRLHLDVIGRHAVPGEKRTRPSAAGRRSSTSTLTGSSDVRSAARPRRARMARLRPLRPGTCQTSSLDSGGDSGGNRGGRFSSHDAMPSRIWASDALSVST